MSSYRKLGRVVDCKIFDKGRLQMTTNKLFSISNFIFFFFFCPPSFWYYRDPKTEHIRDSIIMFE